MRAIDVSHSGKKRNEKVITASRKEIYVLVCIGVYYCVLYPIPHPLPSTTNTYHCKIMK